MDQSLCRPGGIELTDRAVGFCDLPAGARVVDVGCGAGTTVRHLREAHGLDALGIDREAEARGEDPILRGTGEALPLPDRSADVLLFECSLSLMEPDQTLRECRRVLRPGGRLLITDVYARGIPQQLAAPLGRAETRWELTARFRRHGLVLERFEDHSAALMQMWGQMLLEDDAAEPDEAEAARRRTARCGYYLAVLRLPAAPPARSPVEPWALAVTGLTDAEGLRAWQLERAARAVARAREHSAFYREHLAGWNFDGDGDRPPTPEQFAALPFTTGEDIRERGGAMVCVSQREIARISTLLSSGSAGPSKRVYFTAGDLARTLDFFAVGMSAMVGPGETAAILLSSATENSIGDLLARALTRIGVSARLHGNVREVPAALEAARGADCLIGAPDELLYLCRTDPNLRPRSVLLSADYVPESVIAALESAWGCKVFTHYGMTETGYGFGVQCAAGEGYHLRHGEFYVEIVDPRSGAPLPPGRPGEVVITSLCAEAMPLIRYRTGDRAALLHEPCLCGGLLPRLGKVEGRVRDLAEPLSIHRLDEIVFSFPGVRGYRAIRAGREGAGLHLIVDGSLDERALRRMLDRAVSVEYGAVPPGTGRAKRRIDPARPDQQEQ